MIFQNDRGTDQKSLQETQTLSDAILERRLIFALQRYVQ